MADVQVVSAACKTLASLAARSDSAAASLAASAQNYLAALRQSSTSHSAYCSRQVEPMCSAGFHTSCCTAMLVFFVHAFSMPSACATQQGTLLGLEESPAICSQYSDSAGSQPNGASAALCTAHTDERHVQAGR